MEQSVWTGKRGLIVPHALRGNASRDALRHLQSGTRSVPGGVSTRERGNDQNACFQAHRVDRFATGASALATGCRQPYKHRLCPNPAHTRANKGRFTVKPFGHFDPLLASPAVL